VDSSTSGCILATTYYGAGTAATIINSDLSDCTTAVAIGYNNADTAAVTVKGSNIDNVDYIFSTTSDSNVLTAYANNITNFDDAGLNGAQGDINARHNWWGTHDSLPLGVDNDSWNYRLGAARSSWGEGALGSASLTSAGGSGTGIIVSHRRGLANVPFGKGNDPYASATCSDYYDFFVLNANGNWTVHVPIDADVACDDAWANHALYQFTLSGTMPNTACVGGACWEPPTGVAANGRSLEVTLDATTDLLGTPFVAGDNTPDSNDPTAVSLSTFSASTNDMGVITAVILFFVSLTSFIFKK
jgi:hypothetical protein